MPFIVRRWWWRLGPALAGTAAQKKGGKVIMALQHHAHRHGGTRSAGKTLAYPPIANSDARIKRDITNALSTAAQPDVGNKFKQAKHL